MQMEKNLHRNFSIILIFISCLLQSCDQRNHREGYIEGEYTYVASPVAGHLSNLWVTRGETVKAHQRLVTLTPEPENAELAAAEATYQQALANLANLQTGARQPEIAALTAAINQAIAQAKLSEITWQRQTTLFKQHVIQKQVLDEAAAEYQSDAEKVLEAKAKLEAANLPARSDLIKAAEQAVKISKAGVDKAHWYSDEKMLSANQAGIVDDTYFVEGEWVNAGQPILALLAPQNVFAVFFIPEDRLSRIKLGENVTLNCDDCDKSYTATINYIAPHAEFTPPIIYSRYTRDKLVFRVQAKLSASDAEILHPGQPVEVTLGS